jgi:hypothetical protein
MKNLFYMIVISEMSNVSPLNLAIDMNGFLGTIVVDNFAFAWRLEDTKKCKVGGRE